MKISVERGSLYDEVKNIKAQGEKALDYLWTLKWLSDSLSKSDMEQVVAIKATASKLTLQSDIVVVVASGLAAGAVRAMISGRDFDGKPEIIVFGDTLSSLRYVELIRKLEERNFSMICVQTEEDLLEFRAAFTCVRKLLIEKYGPEGAGERMISIVGHEKGFMADEASTDNIESITLSEDASGFYLGNTAAVLLPMAVAGIDIEEYLNGFRDMIADPVWDTMGTEFALANTLAIEKKKKYNGVKAFQKETEYIAEWIDEIGFRSIGNCMAEIVLYCEKETADIALPSFPGCSSEGSLNALLEEQIEKIKRAGNAVIVRFTTLDAYDVGQISAFIQMSFGITSFILNN